MRIGVFVACAGRRDGGPETYEIGLVRALAKVDRDNEYRILCLSQAAADAFGLQQANVCFEILRPRLRAISFPVSLPLSLMREPVDILHATVYPPLISPVDYVFTMHDVSPFVYPDNYPAGMRTRLKFLIGRGLRQAKQIVCVSEHARATTAEHCGIDPDRIAVIHHGIDPRFRPFPSDEAQDLVRQRYQIRAPYVLYVGKLTAPKNLDRMLEAFSLVHRDAPELTLVLCGRRFWDSQFLDDAIARLGLRECVVEPGYVPTEDLPLLYAGATMSLYVSLFEGFGFPLVEAMACGTPVVTSNVSCLPEVAGDGALLVNPNSVEEIADAMRRLHTDPALRATVREKGLARASAFTWDRTATKYLEVYRRASAR